VGYPLLLTSGPNGSANLVESEMTGELGIDHAKERQQHLADHFHHLMTAGGSFKEVNKHRKSFFAEVINKTKEVGFCILFFNM